MGLFTNRKREDEGDVVHAAEAIDQLEPTWINDPPTAATHPTGLPLEASIQMAREPRLPHEPYEPHLPSFPTENAIPELAAPFADEASPVLDADDEGAAERTLADFGITFTDAEPELPPGPRRALTDQPVETAQAGNVAIDAHGLLEMLGVGPEASLIDISEARLRFLAEHDPGVEDDPETAHLKERIRRQVNTAYASFRLTRVD